MIKYITFDFWGILNIPMSCIGSFSGWFIQWIIIVLQVALPIISQKMTFEWFRCRAYEFDDNDIRSYSTHDKTIACNGDDAKYRTILVMTWTVIAIWTFVVPLGFVILLGYIRQSVQTNIITPLANACRFLWQDYVQAINVVLGCCGYVAEAISYLLYKFD